MGAKLRAGSSAWLVLDGLQGKDSWVFALNLLFVYSADGSEEDILNFLRDSVNLKNIQGLGWGLGKAGIGSEKERERKETEVTRQHILQGTVVCLPVIMMRADASFRQG